MKEVKSCRKCNIIFSSDSGEMICNKCKVGEGKTLKLIRDYLYDNSRTSIYDLSVKFNISVKPIEEHIRNDRLNIIKHLCLIVNVQEEVR